MADVTPRERELAAALDTKFLELEQLGLSLVEHTETARALIAETLAKYRNEWLRPDNVVELRVGPSQDGREVALSINNIHLAAMSAEQALMFAQVMANTAADARAKGG